MGFELRPATSRDLDFARELTCKTMLRYYIQHDLLWQDEAFDVAWAGRENWLIVRGDRRLGYVSLSRDARALYIRELHVLEAFRGRVPVPGRSIRYWQWRARSDARHCA